MEYYSAIKGMKLCHLQTWKDLETVIQSEVSQSEKNKYVNWHNHYGEEYGVSLKN